LVPVLPPGAAPPLPVRPPKPVAPPNCAAVVPPVAFAVDPPDPLPPVAILPPVEGDPPFPDGSPELVIPPDAPPWLDIPPEPLPPDPTGALDEHAVRVNKSVAAKYRCVTMCSSRRGYWETSLESSGDRGRLPSRDARMLRIRTSHVITDAIDSRRIYAASRDAALVAVSRGSHAAHVFERLLATRCSLARRWRSASSLARLSAVLK